MTNLQNENFVINLPSKMFFRQSESKGFWDNCKRIDADRVTMYLDKNLVEKSIPEKLCLIHSEVSEALEDYRNGKSHMITGFTENGKPVGFPSELADIVIRVMDLAGALDIDLTKEIIQKMEYNKTREYMHGKKI